MTAREGAAAAPGQAAYETHCAAVGLTGDGYAWGKIDRPARERWERIAQAVIAWQHQNAAAAAQPAPGDELAMLRADIADYEKLLARWPKCPAGCNCRIGIDTDPDANECGCDGPCNGGEQPAPAAAPELAAAMAETRKVQDVLARVLSEAVKGSSGWTIRIGQVPLARAWAAAGGPVPEELRRFL